jgi:putative nucleotidyltransferase with HDIG domain
MANPASAAKTPVRERTIGIEKRKESVRQLLYESRGFRWVMLLAVTAAFTALLYPNLLVSHPFYNLGDVADRDIKAPQDFLIEDSAATEANRRRAADQVLTVYDYDNLLLPTLKSRVNDAFSEMQAVIAATTARQASIMPDPAGAGASAAPDPAPAASPQEVLLQHKSDFEEKLGVDFSDETFRILVRSQFSNEIADDINAILSTVLGKGVVTNKTMLLKDVDKGIVLLDLETKSERIVSDVRQLNDLDQARSAVRIAADPLLKGQSYPLRSLIIDFTQRLIQPNVTLNKSETEKRKQLAGEQIKPILYKIKAGEMLLREGERVTEVQLLKLDALKDQMKNENLLMSSIGAALLLMCLLTTACIVNLPRLGRTIGEQNKSLLFISIVLIAFFMLAQLSVHLSESLTTRGRAESTAVSLVYGTPIASGAMIICLFLGFEVAVPFAVVNAVSTALIFQTSFPLLVFFLINGVMAAYWIRDCRERKVFIKAGGKLGLLNVVLVTAIDIYQSQINGSGLVWDWTFAFLGGVGAGIVTAGIVPLIEIAFNYTTDTKLMELSNLDRPILRQLLMEAPGTYHHSVIVGSMAEAAASDIDANPLLAKVCGYYHDIGKMKKPLYFIENQRDGKNRHDKLAPSMSALILVAHVKDGIDIARKNKLGQAIVDTIQQHHGSSLITYFYDKATQQKGEDSVNIDDFRYPGPKPQTREIALVMLADVVEAASRTLANPTPSRIQGLVQNLINKVFSDGQLDNCELTLKDLHKIAKSFNKILNAIHHHRIEYPDKRPMAVEKAKNGSLDRQPTKQASDTTRENTEKGTGHLKRLGQS